ncbi:LOW QUALITY PROTEIN: hypothetical protein N665_0087s0014 [Sinapis alba]|nr:LOW QUALITY PROTEIN: hypothetical protein N665_0087s0014 [Sinapis alba]
MTHRLSRFEKEKWVPDPQNRFDAPIQILESNNITLIEEHKLTLIGRVTNPVIKKNQSFGGVLPPTLACGKDLGPHLFQFKFEYEYDLQAILLKAPFHFKKWMIILQRWEHVTDVTLKDIEKELGLVDELNVERGRIRVLINGLKSLEMKLDISLRSGEIKQARTLERLEADRKRTEDRRSARMSPTNRFNIYRDIPSNWQKIPSHDKDWNPNRGSNYDYGVRRDYTRMTGSSQQARKEHRLSARERLSFIRDNALIY